MEDLKEENGKCKEEYDEKLAACEALISSERAKLEEAEARFNMEQVSVNESLSLTKGDLTATQEKLMDVVKQNDELRGHNTGASIFSSASQLKMVCTDVLMACT